MILVDYSQVSLSNILAFQSELKKDSETEIKNLIRHVTISTLKSYKKKYSSTYGELVICCDGRRYWRRDLFTHYKAGRKKNRENSDLNWQLIFDTLSEIREEIKQNFPYKVIHFENTEADDIIATMVERTQELGNHEEVLIISSDKDFVQLHKYQNVKQWSPIQKKMVLAKQAEIKNHLIEHIVRGDSGDGIPNVLSPNDVFVTVQRQKPVTKKRLADFFEKGKDACESDEERANWERNEMLISFEKIPEHISNSIREDFENNKPKGDKMSIMNYLMANRCNLLLDEIEEF
jgi:5'-3' exonuclease